MTDVNAFADRVISNFNKRITDQIFLEVQGDSELMREYLGLVERNGLAVVNQAIGKAVKRRYQLTDADNREHRPLSTLIQSHQTFE